MSSPLPVVLAGPLVRRASPHEVSIWLCLSEPARVDVQIFAALETLVASREPKTLAEGSRRTVRLGEHLHVVVVTATAVRDPLPTGAPLGYDATLVLDSAPAGSDPRRLRDLSVRLGYAPFSYPTFVLRDGMPINVLHASCRKAHGSARDGMALVDLLLREGIPGTADLALRRPSQPERPSALYLTGDQIYADDVAPELAPWIIETGFTLVGTEIVPVKDGVLACNRLTGRRRGQELAVFTSEAKEHHLVGLGELAAMYLLAFSNVLRPSPCPRDVILPAEAMSCRRALANIATYMMLDDHEVTDDWNLHRAWHEAATADPLGRRVIANALVAFWAFQGWGNRPGADDEVWARFLPELLDRSREGDSQALESLVFRRNWTFESPGYPSVIMLDTRTDRHFPPGKDHATDPPWLMQPEALAKLGETVARVPSSQPVIVASPAPFALLSPLGELQLVDGLRKGSASADLESWLANSTGLYAVKQRIHEKLGSRPCFVLGGDVHHGYALVEQFAPVRDRRSSLFVHFTSSALKNPPTKNDSLGLEAASRLAIGDVATTYVFHRTATVPQTDRFKKLGELAAQLLRSAGARHVSLAQSEHLRVSEAYAQANLPGEQPDIVERRQLRLRAVAGSNVGQLKLPHARKAELYLHLYDERGERAQRKDTIDLGGVTPLLTRPKPPPRTGGVVLLPDGYMASVLFADFGVSKIELTEEHEESLDLLAAVMQSSPDARAFFEGRASQTGGEGDNRWLSEMRAEAIRNGLRKRGVPALRLLEPVVAHGASSPIHDRPGQEDPINRSVVVTYTVPNLRVAPPPVVPPPPRTDLSTKWAIWVMVGGNLSIGGTPSPVASKAAAALRKFGRGLGGGVSLGVLWNRTSNEKRWILLPGLGLAGGLSFLQKTKLEDLEELLGSLPTADLGTFSDFRTQSSCSFADFHLTMFRLTSLSIGWYVSSKTWSYIAFPALFILNSDDKDATDTGIDIGGSEFGSVGLGGSMVFGPCLVLGRAA